MYPYVGDVQRNKNNKWGRVISPYFKTMTKIEKAPKWFVKRWNEIEELNKKLAEILSISVKDIEDDDSSVDISKLIMELPRKEHERVKTLIRRGIAMKEVLWMDLRLEYLDKDKVEEGAAYNIRYEKKKK